MTSDTAKPETTPAAKPESFRSHLPAIVAATTGTMLAAVLGSLIGAAGTIAGMVIGSLASGTCSWWAERGIRRSAALAAARAEAIRARGRPLHPSEEAAVTQAAEVTPDTGAAERHERRMRRWAGPAAFIAVAFIACAIVVTLLEGATGKPLSAVVQGKPGHGTTLGGGSVGKAASPSPSPAPTSSGSLSPTSSTITKGVAASTTPSGASSSPAASAAPASTTPTSTSTAGSTPDPATPTPTSTTG